MHLVVGEPEDLGPLAVYLAAEASRFMTGATLVIDGGCVQFVSAVEEADIACNFDIYASCEPSGDAPIGAAEGSEPVTVCCRG